MIPIKIRILVLISVALMMIGCSGSSTLSESENEYANQGDSENANLGDTKDPTLSAALANTGDSAQAHRFLEQSTFGPSPKSIDQVNTIGFEAWIDEQMSLMPTLMLPQLMAYPSPRWAEYVNIWWKNTLTAEDQLRQRVAFALSEIFVVSAKDGLGEEQQGLANYYDILVRNAFGNYRELLNEITLNPVMGEYLSMKGNRKPDAEQNIRPDENYARELLQLFSIGTTHLNSDGSQTLNAKGNPQPTYNQEVVEGFAHVFTGWHYSNADHFLWPSQKDYLNPMRPFHEFHDLGPKKLLRGFETAAGKNAQQDLKVALDNIFQHPNVGPFIAKQLIQKLVTSNPSSSYISDIATVFDTNDQGERGSLGSVVKAILLHDEARNGHIKNPDTFGKLKEAVIRVSAIWRAFPPDRIAQDFNYSYSDSDIGQAVLNAPSVFNFFTPAFSQPGAIREAGLLSPEFQLHDESTIIRLTSRLLMFTINSHNYSYESDQHRMALNISRAVQLEEESQDLLLDYLDDLLLGGEMSTELRAESKKLMSAYDYDSGGPQRVVEAIFLIISSPESAIQQ